MWRTLIRVAGVCLGIILLSWAVTIIRESRFDGSGLSVSAIAVSLSYAVAGVLLVVPWSIMRPLVLRRLAFVLLLACSVVGLLFGFLPALSWAFIHGATPPLVLLAVAVGLLALLSNLGLGVYDLLRGNRLAGRASDSAA